MKASVVVGLFLAASAHGHAILQRISVSGSDKGLLVGLRAPNTNNPVTNVQSNDIICNAAGSTSSTIIDVAAGSQVGIYYQHIIGGAQGSNDPDNPIAPSHKGPIQVYLAKVDNAASTGTSGLKWFKVASEGETGGHWAVDTMIANNGWWYFTLPSCIASGNYLMRGELIALHSAYSSGGAQFYMSCGQINVTGGGSFTPSSTVSFPGVYSASDPGILINIYDGSGQPTNGNNVYTAPGPAVITCSGSSNNPSSSSSSSSPKPSSSSSSSAKPSSSSSSGGSTGGAALYGQCGGEGWTGPTTCSQGTCKVSNQWYSQCLP